VGPREVNRIISEGERGGDRRIPNGIFFASPQRSRGINVITAGVEPLALNKQ